MSGKTHPCHWIAEAKQKENWAEPTPLQRDIEADICIVGGGYTGLWTAIMLKQKSPNKKVVILEKSFCGSGASGVNGGCLLTWATKYPSMVKMFGEKQAKFLVEESEHVVFEIEAFCQEHDINAGLRRNGTYYTATNTAQRGSMSPTVEKLDRLGINSWRETDEQELNDNTGSARHVEGYYSEAAGSVQPALLARGLRKVALELGVEIFENSEMLELKYGQPVTVITKQGSIRAQQVVLALNAWMVEKFKAFKNSIVVVSSDMVITKPVPELLKKSKLAEGVTVVDSRIFVHYYRDTVDGRLMLGKGGNQFSFNNQVDPMFNQPTKYLGLLNNAFDNLFPNIGREQITANWTGGSDRSTTGFPFFGNINKQDNVFYGLGYSGNGVAQTRIGGKILSSMVLAENNDYSNCALTGGPRGYFPPEPARWLGAMMVRDAVRRKESAEDNERKPFVLDKLLSKLAGPAGKADKV
ncbi:FAD-dependent oxidoreductase [Vibrio superstes]|uniref:FAD-dependent oxidoreductase n=1 Tax=Vibrio superstes NBRC 103154 TaxID=1219062 RepID=A0A511QW49_9VIBR|nr:FAD-dependent oxidoreductase [Vibrio superstes]GEM81604.1 FAD-dependent oxidoreductase [Vibrio superstes NBRC 103154]